MTQTNRQAAWEEPSWLVRIRILLAVAAILLFSRAAFAFNDDEIGTGFALLSGGFATLAALIFLREIGPIVIRDASEPLSSPPK